MSHSRRHTPIAGTAGSPSEKKDKRIWNSKFRKATKQRLNRDPDILPLNIRKETELWNGAKDGKMFFDPSNHPELMRK